MSWGQLVRIIILIIVLLVVAGLVVRACLRIEPPVEPDILNSLPVEWRVVYEGDPTAMLSLTPDTPWREVNIDGDADPEYLLLYNYDNSDNTPGSEVKDGPVGGLIYDLQDTSEFNTGQPARPIPLQPSGFYVPYRLLPSYWRGLDGAFIGTPGSGPNVKLYQIPRTAPTVGDSITGSAQVNTELILTASDNTLTFVWWRNLFDGYGATQIRGPAGFRAINGKWDTLGAWAESQEVIEKIDALFSIHGELGLAGVRTTIDYADISRSLLCRVIQYQRIDKEFLPSTIAGSVYQSDVEYISREQGIQFCKHMPDHPFYPEGVVVKYLLSSDSRGELLWAELADEQKDRILRATVFDADTEWIESVETRAKIDYPDSFRTTQPPSLVETRRLPTQVCVEIQRVAGDDSGRRLLYFSLINTPPTVDENASQAADDSAVNVRVSDRLWVTDLVDATEWRVSSCAELVALDAQRELENNN